MPQLVTLAGPRKLVERDDALGSLTQAVQSARKGQGSTVIISGEAGIGKTSLLRAFAALDTSQARILWGGL